LVFSIGVGIIQASETKEITIGYAVSLSGRFGVEGKETDRGYRMWRDQINQAGGLTVGKKRYPVKFVFYDDESNPSICAKLYDKLITRDKVDLILSPWSSGLNFAASAVAEKYRYPVIMSSASATKLFERGFKYIFETTQLSPTMMAPWTGFLKANSGKIKTVAILYENFLFTLALNKSLVENVKEAGAKLVLNEMYPIGGKDFTGLLLKVKGVNPDALFVLNIMPASVYATRQANEVGVRPKLLMVNIGPMFEEEFIGGLGDLSERVYESGFWHPELPFAGAKKFAKEFETIYNKRPSTDAAYAYISTQVLTQAIGKAGSIDRETLTKTLRSGKYQTILGPYDYDERGVNKVQEGFICQVQNKERVIVWPKDLANAKPQFIR
jgi:branched-chain amino acid transport system substrate-binding protein